MATILTFRSAESRTGGGAGQREGSSAQVILFPGIRYERWGEADTGASAASDSRKNRDVLELAE